MNIAARVGMWSGGKHGGVPAGWVEVEYIESTGTQLIDTGIIGYSDTRVKCKCALIYANNVYPAMWGARTGSRINDFQIYYVTGSAGGIPSSIILRTGSDQKEVKNSDIGVSTSLVGLPLEIDARSGAFVVNGHSFTAPSFNFTTPDTIRMFCEFTNSYNSNFGSFKYWHWSAYKGENELIHLVGVRNATTNEGAMCDVLTGEIYHNAGTGDFIVGPDKS